MIVVLFDENNILAVLSLVSLAFTVIVPHVHALAVLMAIETSITTLVFRLHDLQRNRPVSVCAVIVNFTNLPFHNLYCFEFITMHSAVS